LYKIPANTLLLGKNMVFVPECLSTNDYALDLTQNSNVCEGTIVITSNQTAGRGQRGNTWETEPGKNLTFSVILKPKKLAIMEQFYLNICVSLAIHDYIKQKNGTLVQIKWPNDVLVDGRKICGILIENQIKGSMFSNCIVGIGLNMNQQNFCNTKATSLSLISGKQYDLNDELSLLLGCLEGRYFELEHLRYQKLLDDYLKVMYWRHEPHVFISNDQDLEGTITGIDKLGRLEVETSGGKKYFGMKEIAYKS
jgi:BirA family biotin operon repressor/biotin-[acetyl-CoA-carboxylase] ligase